MKVEEKLRRWPDTGGILSQDEAKELITLLDGLARAFNDERAESFEYRRRLAQVLKPDAVEKALSPIELAQVRQHENQRLREGIRLLRAVEFPGLRPEGQDNIAARVAADEWQRANPHLIGDK